MLSRKGELIQNLMALVLIFITFLGIGAGVLQVIRSRLFTVQKTVAVDTTAAQFETLLGLSWSDPQLNDTTKNGPTNNAANTIQWDITDLVPGRLKKIVVRTFLTNQGGQRNVASTEGLVGYRYNDF